jgi:hypothetical protein
MIEDQSPNYQEKCYTKKWQKGEITRQKLDIFILYQLKHLGHCRIWPPPLGGLIHRQRKYAVKLLTHVDVLKCIQSTTHMSSSKCLCSTDGEVLSLTRLLNFSVRLEVYSTSQWHDLIFPLLSIRCVNTYMSHALLIDLLLSASLVMHGLQIDSLPRCSHCCRSLVLCRLILKCYCVTTFV